MNLSFGQQDTTTPGPDAVFAVKHSSKTVDAYAIEWQSKLADVPNGSQPDQSHCITWVTWAVS